MYYENILRQTDKREFYRALLALREAAFNSLLLDLVAAIDDGKLSQVCRTVFLAIDETAVCTNISYCDKYRYWCASNWLHLQHLNCIVPSVDSERFAAAAAENAKAEFEKVLHVKEYFAETELAISLRTAGVLMRFCAETGLLALHNALHLMFHKHIEKIKITNLVSACVCSRKLPRRYAYENFRQLKQLDAELA